MLLSQRKLLAAAASAALALPSLCAAAQGYDPVRDLQAVMMITTAPYLILTTPSLPVTSVKDLVALAKSKPGAISFASAGQGSILHLGAELLVALSGTQMLHVPYKGPRASQPRSSQSSTPKRNAPCRRPRSCGA